MGGGASEEFNRMNDVTIGFPASIMLRLATMRKRRVMLERTRLAIVKKFPEKRRYS